MKKSHECEVATHIGPESCGAALKGGVEALTGERAGRVFAGVLGDGKRTRVEEGRRRVVVLRRCWLTFTSIMCSTCGSKHGVASAPTAT